MSDCIHLSDWIDRPAAAIHPGLHGNPFPLPVRAQQARGGRESPAGQGAPSRLSRRAYVAARSSCSQTALTFGTMTWK